MTAQPVEPVINDPQVDEPQDTEGIDNLGYTFSTLAQMISLLSDDVPAALDVDDTRDTVVTLLADLRRERQRLAEIEAFVEAAAVRRLTYGRNEVAGWVAEVKGGTDRKAWRHDELAWAVCRDLAVDKDTGEIVPEVREIVDQVRNRILNACAPSYWRAGILRQLDVDPDEFCERSPGRKTVRLVPVADEAAAVQS